MTVKQIALTASEYHDTLYLLDDTGSVWQGWQEKQTADDGTVTWPWAWKPVNLPEQCPVSRLTFPMEAS